MKNNVSDLKTGFIAGSFDLVHPGYIKMFEDAKRVCDFLIVALHDDPSSERPHKNKPVQTVKERGIILGAIKHIDDIVCYKTEDDLYNLLQELRPDVRILGSDYKSNPNYTGYDLNIPIYFHSRDHRWSCSELKSRIILEASK